MRDLPYFKFWCQKVLPLVYDESLSYYEVLCKVVDYINKLIASDKEIVDNIQQLKSELAVVQEWIDNFDEKIIGEWLEEHLMNMFFVEINNDGYFVIYIPEGWKDVTFKTSGWDEVLEPPLDYGHLILHY